MRENSIALRLEYIEEIAETLTNVKNEEQLHEAYSALIDEVIEIRHLLGLPEDEE